MELDGFAQDPVFEGCGLWYFWDETWANNYGPYDTEAEARNQLRLYCHFLNGNLPEQKSSHTVLTIWNTIIITWE